MMRDATGRWVSFVVSGQSLLLVDRKTVPDHLSSLNSLDTVASLDEILLELQDAGEAILLLKKCKGGQEFHVSVYGDHGG